MQQCQELIDMGLPRLQRSTGWDVEKGSDVVSDYRNSSQTFFAKAETPLIAEIEQRISRITNIPVENGEGLQFLRYDVNQHYKPHWDFFDPNFYGNRQVLEARGGQRIVTFMIYLNDVGKGGETNFLKLPNADRTDSLKIKPETGKALMWYNVLLDGTGRPDKDTYHEGMDVLEGEKYVLNKWLRERKFE
jgi:prolyl 4-hydroxylase